MAHPDDGYLIPDEDWQGLVHPETGENFYPEDRFAGYRNLLIQARQDEKAGIVRPGHAERVAKLRKLREQALNARLANNTEDSQ